MTGLGSSCGACKFLRRRCTNECVFAPYFCYDQASAHFSAVHKVFGASNVSKLLLHLPAHSRGEAALTISYEALARMQDPIYGCVAHIFALQQQVACLKEEIEIIGNQMAAFAFDVTRKHAEPEAENNPINDLQFSSELVSLDINHLSSEWTDMNLDEQRRPEYSPEQSGNSVSANEDLYSLVYKHLPVLSGIEKGISYPCPDSSLSEMGSEGLEQENYHYYGMNCDYSLYN